MTTSRNTMPARNRTATRLYGEAGIEPTIAEVLAEPIVQTLMKRDSISRDTLVRVIDDARRQLAERAA